MFFLLYSPLTLVRVFRKKKMESESLQTNKNLLKLLWLAKEFIDLLSEKKRHQNRAGTGQERATTMTTLERVQHGWDWDPIQLRGKAK